jgi:regulator of nonsense transcripts 1
MAKKRQAFFMIRKNDEDLRLVAGDELKLKYEENGQTKWKSKGHIVRVEGETEEVCMELKNSRSAPTDVDANYTIEFVWKSTSFDRMKLALKIFLKDEASISEYLFYKLLGYNTKEQFLRNNIPKQLSVTGQPELNHF